MWILSSRQPRLVSGCCMGEQCRRKGFWSCDGCTADQSDSSSGGAPSFLVLRGQLPAVGRIPWNSGFENRSGQ